MNKSLIILFVIIFINGCGKSDEKFSKKDVETFNIIPGANSDSGPLPDIAYTLSSQIYFYNFIYSEELKMEKAIQIIKLVVATDEFRSKVLNHSYDGRKTFVDNNGYTNTQIYQKILEAAETLQPTKNNRIDADVELYYEASNIVGYTYASTNKIWVNKKYFSSYTPAGVAHNLFHEWMHKLGFKHSRTWSESRDYSVPYSLGYLVGEIGKDFL
jgi:hypothetical protein